MFDLHTDLFRVAFLLLLIVLPIYESQNIVIRRFFFIQILFSMMVLIDVIIWFPVYLLESFGMIYSIMMRELLRVGKNFVTLFTLIIMLGTRNSVSI